MSVTTAITIGNFDGVHLGHAELIRAARAAVGRVGRVVAVSFDPHPLTVLRPQEAPARLSTFAQRKEWLRQVGADEVGALEPTPQFLAQSPREFMAAMVKLYQPAFIIEGSDFRFGKKRAGSIDTLRELEVEFGYKTMVVDPIEAALSDQSIVVASSSLIRWLLSHGRVRDAGMLLGRPYELQAEVVSGDRRGRTINMPTANLAHGDYLLPADGIYAGSATLPNGEAFPAAISVGTKPTFGEHPRTCEAHLIGYNGPLDHYGWTIRLEFNDWLRDQLTYPNVELLIEQLKRDIERSGQGVVASG